MSKKSHEKQIFQDVIYILLSVFVAYIAIRIGFVNEIVGLFNGYAVIGIFIAGMFFTSVFTTAPAMVLLGGFAMNNDILTVILVGALGAAVGDYFIFRFMRDRVADDIEYILHAAHEDRIKTIFHRRIFRWFVPLVGALIIASPLPDELGIAMLGISRTKSRNFVVISYVFNAVGIMVIALVATGIFGMGTISKQPKSDIFTFSFTAPTVEIVRGDRNKQQVIFTFDGGSGMQSGEQILAALSKHRVKGTFFLTGKFIEQNPLFVAEIAAAGHEIFNHTYDHPHLPTLTDEQITTELYEMNNLLVTTLASTTARDDKWNVASAVAPVDISVSNTSSRPYFRPPYGDRDDRVKEVAARYGYRCVYWTVDARDWEESTGETATNVTERIIGSLSSGNIYLMHLGDNITGQILDDVFTTIEGKGYKIVSLTEGL